MTKDSLSKPILDRLSTVRRKIIAIKRDFDRENDDIVLLAVSKTRKIDEVLIAYEAGVRTFGENYLQEALAKMAALADTEIEWHFIGPLQSNKCQAVASHFDWVQTVDRLKVAQRLSQYRPNAMGPLNVCIQVNISDEASKSGVAPAAVLDLCQAVSALEGLRLRGLMAIPAANLSEAQSREIFNEMKQLFEMCRSAGYAMDTLSMGMSADYPAAIAEGATCIRIGSDIFGPRE
jgi:PLP dependent protein